MLRPTKLLIALLLFCTLCMAAPTEGATEELSYDSGSCIGTINGIAAGDLVSTRFTPQAPAKVLSVLIKTTTAGTYPVTLWKDGGGHQPDTDLGVMTNINVEVTAADTWAEADVSGMGIELEALRNYFAGQIIAAPENVICVAGKNGTERAMLRIGADWYGLSDGVFAVRLKVAYRDVASDFTFTNVTEAAGLTGIGSATRVAWGDYNNDGYPDLMIGGNRLFKNNGDSTFTEATAEAGIGGTPAGGGVWGDYDNDGFLDIYTTVNSLTDRDILWHNNGDGTFTNVTAQAGEPSDLLPTEAAAWGDINNDGFIDIYAANYETPGETLSQPNPDFLWLNNGNGTFRDVSVERGIREFNDMCGRGVAFADFNNDGWQDIYLSNYRLNPNYLFVNNGKGYFTNESYERGVMGQGRQSSYGHTIGSAWADYDNDGYWDLFAANIAHPRFIDFSDKSMLYHNSGAPDYIFKDMREAAGITYAETHSDPSWGDYDNDGFVDLFITSIYEERESFLYHNNGDGTFKEVSYPSGMMVFNGWGAAWADYDNDGNLDMFAGGQLFRNNGSAGHWFKLRLKGVDTNSAAIGTVVKLSCGALKMMRQVEGGKGTSSQSPMELHFGTGECKIADEVKIKWLGGKEQVLKNLPADKIYLITEGIDPDLEPSQDADTVPDDDAAIAPDTDTPKSSSSGGCSVVGI